MEFGGELLNIPGVRITPENMDEKIKEGKTPEQFLSNYNFDENQRDVIVFRPPTLRDIQIYDVIKTIDGFYGLIIAIQSYPYAFLRKHIYNFTAWGHNAVQLDQVIPGVELTNLPNYNEADNYIIKQIEVIRPANQVNAKDLNYMRTFVNSNTKVKSCFVSYRVTDICEIHKNIHNSATI